MKTKNSLKKNERAGAALGFFLLLAGGTLFAQGLPLSAEGLAEPARGEVDTLAALDGQVRRLGVLAAAELNRRDNPRVRVSFFTADDTEPPLGIYWKEQLAAALAGTGTKRFTLLESESSRPEQGGAADYELSGEILELGETVRIYTRLVRPSGGELEQVWTTDLPVNDFIAELLESPSRNNSAPRVRPDSYEPDSMESPVEIELGLTWISRTLHRGDEDWFSFTADSGLLIAETSGNMDTYMDLYDGDSLARLESDDDSGEGANARIEYPVQAGKKYIVKVRPYDRDDTGAYRFRAYMDTLPEDPWEPNDDMDQAALIPINEPVRAYFHRDDVDWYKAEIPQTGQVTIYTESGLDTYITVYDEDGEELGSDDDSGQGNNARLDLNAPAGIIYIEVTEYNGDRGQYTLYVKTE